MNDTKLQEVYAQVQAANALRQAEYNALETRMEKLKSVSKAGKIPRPLRDGWKTYITGKHLCPYDRSALQMSQWGYGFLGAELDIYFKCPTCDYEFLD